MKKPFSILLTVCTFLFLAIMLVACSKENYECEHTYEYRVTRSATCAHEGLSEEICSKCGKAKPSSTPQIIPKSETHTRYSYDYEDNEYHIKQCYECGSVLERSKHSLNDVECTVCEKPILEYRMLDDETGYAVSGVNFKQLESITVPAAYRGLPVVEIDRAFYQSEVKSITLPDGLLTIGEEAFYGSNITEIVIPASVTEIGEYAFSGCEELRTVVFASEIGWTSLGDSIFEDCIALENINLPAGLTEIGAKAFYNCRELSVVDLPDTLTCVGEYAFARSGIRHLYLPDSLVELGDCAFAGSPLITVRLGTQLQIMPSNSFGTSLFSVIEFCNDSSLDIPCFAVNEYSSSGGQSVITNNNGWVTCRFDAGDGTTRTYLLEYVGEKKEITVPSSYALWKRCFYNNDDIVSVTLPDAISLNDTSDLFWGCDNIKKIVLPEFFTNNSGSGDFRNIGFGMFGNCCSLESITIPNGYYSFAPDYAAPDNPFFNVPTTCTIKYSGSEVEWVKEFGYTYGASVNAERGYEYTLSEDGTYYIVSGIGTITDTELYFPSMHKGLPVKEIGNEAFKDLYGELDIESVYIHDTIKVIGENAFTGNKLTELEWDTSLEGRYEIKYSAFSGCDYLSTVTIGGPVNLGASAFGACASLQYFDAEGVREIGDAAFYYCEELTTFLGSPREIGHDAFAGCSKLQSIDLSYTVSLGYDAFRDCKSLRTVTIPASLTVLETNLFKGCSALLSVTFEEGSRLTTIEGGVFSGCARLTELDIPESVTEIGTAFYGCSSLTKIILPKGAISIGGYSGCTALETIIIPSGVTKIDAAAFEDCTALKTVIIEPNSVLNLIEGAAFNNCSSLAKIYFGGTKGAWDSIMATTSMLNNAPLATVTVYFYSESEPTDIGSYWHYDANSQAPVLW